MRSLLLPLAAIYAVVGPCSLAAVPLSSVLTVTHVDRPDLLALIDLPQSSLGTFDAIDRELPLFQGWCHPTKAKWLYAITRVFQPQVGCEVGVFGGASVYPVALAMLHNRQGSFIGIDPWRPEPCLEGYAKDDPNYQWWANLDYEAIYRQFMNDLARNGLSDIVTPLKMTGEEAVHKVPQLDYLHIDGNHSEVSALRDVEMYVPKCHTGAIIIMDDVNWHSTRKAQAELAKMADRIFVCKTSPGQVFAVYRKK
ncbi:MAG: class I SAM-dependent methyltransferase [Chlamydiia bacterium]